MLVRIVRACPLRTSNDSRLRVVVLLVQVAPARLQAQIILQAHRVLLPVIRRAVVPVRHQAVQAVQHPAALIQVLAALQYLRPRSQVALRTQVLRVQALRHRVARAVRVVQFPLTVLAVLPVHHRAAPIPTQAALQFPPAVVPTHRLAASKS